MSITLAAVTKRHGTNVVVDRVSLEVAERELFVLLGTSGSGKSTILRIVAGLVEPDSGRVVMRGRDVTKLPPQGRDTGFVFQDYSLFRHMSVGENVEFGLRLRGMRRGERRERREELLDLVGLAGHAGRFPRQLSGGQQQRVALARALAYKPDVLLLDEPFGALDARTRAQLRRTLREIQEGLGVTTVLVTHDQDEAFELADRVGLLDRGRLVEVGDPETLYRAPRTQFAATFVGAGAVLVGDVRDGALQFGERLLALPAEPRREDGNRAQILLRPEQVIVSDAGSAPVADAIALGRGAVVSEAFAGGSRRLRVAVSRPPGVRQVAPTPPFGEERLLLDAVVSAETPAGRTEVDVALRGWHALAPEPPRLLVLEPDASPEAFAFAVTLARGLRGTVAVLAVAESADGVAAKQARVAGQLAERGAVAELNVRSGDLARALQLELHESQHALVVLGLAAGRPSRAAVELLDRPSIPLLFVPKERASPKKVLACTAVGEPGEHAVRLAGWLARRLGGSVTLLHVVQGAAEPGTRARTYLARGEATLRSMDVASKIDVRHAAAASAGILAAAEEGDHDVVVIGHHHGLGTSVDSRDNVTAQVLAAATRPVLVISGLARR